MAAQDTAETADVHSADAGHLPPRTGNRRSFLASTEFQLILGLALLCAYFALTYAEQFVTSSNLTNMSRVGGILLVAAIGQMFALVVGGFDISVAANMGIVSTVTALVMTQQGSVTAGVLFGLVAGSLVGLANGVLIAGLGVSPFVATLGMLTFLDGYANQISGGASVAGLPVEFQVFGGGDWGPIPASVGIATLIFVVVWFLLSRTRAGLYIYSIGGSRETTRLAGVRVVRYEILAYTLCGFFAGVAGVMLASRVSVGQASLGQGYELLSIATAVIGGVAIGGGLGRLSGVVLGVALMTTLTTGMDIAGTSQFVQQMITGAVLVASVLLARARGFRFADLVRLRRKRV